MSTAHSIPAPEPSTPSGRAALRRLRQIYRSAGWPCQDTLELELLAAGLIERIPAAEAARPETLRLTDAGVRWVAEAQTRGRRALGAHDQLVHRTANWLAEQGRLAWTSLSLFAANADDGRWGTCRPDVFSIRASSLDHALEPTVHEIKVSRADLLGDLRQCAKRAAYLQVAQRCWYVLADHPVTGPIADPSEIPDECGVVLASTDALRIVRPAPAREARVLSLQTWLALARSQPVQVGSEPAQLELGSNTEH